MACADASPERTTLRPFAPKLIASGLGSSACARVPDNGTGTMDVRLTFIDGTRSIRSQRLGRAAVRRQPGAVQSELTSRQSSTNTAAETAAKAPPAISRPFAVVA